MGLLSALGRGAKSFGKHYANTAGAGMAYGALAGGGLNTYGDMQNGGEFDPSHTLEGMVGGALIGSVPGGALGIGRGAVGAARAMQLTPAIVAFAKKRLVAAGVPMSKIRQLADDDLVRLVERLGA